MHSGQLLTDVHEGCKGVHWRVCVLGQRDGKIDCMALAVQYLTQSRLQRNGHNNKRHLNEACNVLTMHGTTSFGSGRECWGVWVSPHPIFRIGTCVDQTQVIQSE